MSNTITLNFKKADGSLQFIEAKLGESVMEAAIFNNVDGIEAECGGSCMCATCHVYLSDSLQSEMPEPAEEESEMLDEAEAERRPGSRLSCQLVVTEALANQMIEVPECQ